MDIPPWVMLAFLAGLTSNIFSFLNRFFLKDQDDPTSWAWFSELLRLISFIPFIFFDYYLNFNLTALIILLLVGLSEFASTYFYMKMHAYTHLSISIIVSRVRMIWIPVFAFFLMGEKLQISEYAGIIILFVGLSIVVTPHKMFVDKGTIYANLSAITIAINTVFQKMALPFASIPIVMVAFTLPSVILFPVFMKDAKKRLVSGARINLLPKIGAIIISLLGMYLFLTAMKIGDVSKVNAIYQSMMIFSVLAGIIILKEKQDILKKLIGSIITIAGVIMLT